MSLSRHALSRAAASEHGQGFSAAHAQIDPIQNLLMPETLVQILDGDNGHTASCSASSASASQFHRSMAISVPSRAGSGNG